MLLGRERCDNACDSLKEDRNVAQRIHALKLISKFGMLGILNNLYVKFGL